MFARATHPPGAGGRRRKRPGGATPGPAASAVCVVGAMVRAVRGRAWMTAPRTALVTPTRRKPSRHPYTSPPQAPRWNTCRQRGPGRVPAGPCARQPGQAERAGARAGSEHLGGDERRYCSSDALRWVSASVCVIRGIVMKIGRTQLSGR